MILLYLVVRSGPGCERRLLLWGRSKGNNMSYKKIYPWVLVGLLWGVGLLNYLDRQMLSTMKSAMQTDIAELRSATNFGYLMGIFLWIYGFMSPVAGIIAD